MNHVLVRFPAPQQSFGIYYLYGDEEIPIGGDILAEMKGNGWLTYICHKNNADLYEFTGEPFYWRQ